MGGEVGFVFEGVASVGGCARALGMAFVIWMFFLWLELRVFSRAVELGYPVFRRCLNGIGWHVCIAFEAQKSCRLKIGGGIE